MRGQAGDRIAVLDAQEIQALAWEAVPACSGVEQKMLWRHGGFAQALHRPHLPTEADLLAGLA